MEHLLRIKNVSQSQLSIARLTGGCIINGKEYIYNPQTDSLILKTEIKKPNKKPYISNQLKINL